MLQRQIALAALEHAGLTGAPPGSPLARFLAWLAQRPEACWDDVVARARRDVPDQLDALAVALWDSGDALLRANVMRRLDPERPEELATLEKLIGRARGDADAESLRAALEGRHPEVVARIARKRAVPAALRDEVRELVRLAPRS
jgi:hypothetical protein